MTMSELFKAPSPTSAWMKGLTHLENRDGWRDYNLVLEIAKPMSLSPGEKRIAIELGAFLDFHGKKPISTVLPESLCFL